MYTQALQQKSEKEEILSLVRLAPGQDTYFLNGNSRNCFYNRKNHSGEKKNKEEKLKIEKRSLPF